MKIKAVDKLLREMRKEFYEWLKMPPERTQDHNSLLYYANRIQKAIEAVPDCRKCIFYSSPQTVAYCVQCPYMTTKSTRPKKQAALAAPPRNCDRFGWRDAWEKWRTENHPKKPVTYKEAYDCTAAFMDWFMGTAEKGGAK